MGNIKTGYAATATSSIESKKIWKGVKGQSYEEFSHTTDLCSFGKNNRHILWRETSTQHRHPDTKQIL